MQSQGNKYFGSRTKKIINEEKQEVKRNYIDHTTDVLFMLKKKKLFNLIWIGNEQWWPLGLKNQWHSSLDKRVISNTEAQEKY